MASDVVPVLAESMGSVAPEYGLTPYSGAVAYAGGMDYVEPLEDAGFEAPEVCSAHKKNGLPCRAYASRDGLCVGHLRQRES